MNDVLMFAQQVKLNPDLDKLPGGGVAQGVIDGVAAFALLVCLACFVIGAALWAGGSHSTNYQRTTQGKVTVTVSVVAALLIGGAAPIVNFFYRLGQNV